MNYSRENKRYYISAMEQINQVLIQFYIIKIIFFIEFSKALVSCLDDILNLIMIVIFFVSRRASLCL